IRPGSAVPALGASQPLIPSIAPEPALPSETAILNGQNELASLQRRRYSAFGTATDNSDQSAFRRKANPYSSIPALIDLYQQAPAQNGKLPRFGSSVFANGTGNFDELPMDVPVGPDYVVGPGDGINVEMWGSVSQRLQRVVDREGRVS